MGQVTSTMNTSPTESNSAESEQEAIFSQYANSAWGIAFITTEAVTSATDAVGEGFTELFRAHAKSISVESTKFAILQYTRYAAARIIEEGPHTRHSREPVSLLGETKDRQATLALTALSEPLRSILWLTEAERLTADQVGKILSLSVTDVFSNARQARVDFRRFYVDATKRDGLNAACNNNLDHLAAYGSQSLDATERIAVEAHLATCDSCRGIVAKLSDLETRLRAAIPAIPAWTRQYVLDTWDSIKETENIIPLPVKPAAQKKGTNVTRNIATAVAGLAIIGATVIGLTYPSKDKNNPAETSSSQLAAPENAHTTEAPVGGDDTSAVTTPVFRATPPATATNSQNAVVAADANKKAVVVTTPPATTVTTAAPTTTTTQPSNALVDLPPVPNANSAPTTQAPTQ